MLKGGERMKRYQMSLRMLTAVILAGSSPVAAHDGHHHQSKAARAEWDDSAGPPSQPGTNVTIKLFQYQPGRMQVKAGTMVTWVNQDEIFHTVTAEKKHGGFDALLENKGKSFSFIFSQPGTYAYYCERHEHMRGEIEVR
jgi:plastocyanin